MSTIPSPQPPLKALEFFSGIGGLHYALRLAQPTAAVLAAFDINQIANAVYTHNFRHAPSTRSITALTAAELAAHAADLWLLSPPCQPFTAGGKGMDERDERSRPLLHLVDVLGEIHPPPKWVFLENVPNFERSECRRRLLTALKARGFVWTEYLVSPMMLGIPNDRRRYYLAARRDPDAAAAVDLETALAREPETRIGDSVEVEPLAKYLDPAGDVDSDEALLVPHEWILARQGFRFDIVTPESKRSATVTKSYGTKMVTRSGSMLQTAEFETDINFEDTPSLLRLRLRFLSPTEVARLHAFPVDAKDGEEPRLAFPDDVPNKQRWALLGNSLNVKVVATLLELNFFKNVGSGG
ncbi:C-5 cytosine-specific DNA methylase [Phlyctochytrium bullatum]|nr:C-5 cytosine-specific DNA methylase [Phlyctochytrium bullatum]